MPESLHLIGAAAANEWSRWLEPVPHDFYHTAGYHRFSAESGEGRAFLAVYGSPDRYLAWPYLLRAISRERLCDVTSVYGYPGPLAFRCTAGDPFLDRARRGIEELWRSQHVVSVFTRFHPLLENQRWAEGGFPDADGGVSAGGSTVSIDLTCEPAAVWRDYQAGLRNRILRGRRLGLLTEPDDSWSRLEDFVRLYHATMARNHALPFYFFSVDYFRRLKRALGSQAVLMVTRLHGVIAAAGIFVGCGGIVQNHFCVNHEAYLRLSPSKVLLDDARLWAAAGGNRVFHLGGGRGGAQDSLFAFKAAFSRRRHRFYTGRWILNVEAYRSLCSGLPASARDFFPAYRAPGAASRCL
jgi:hypothetical protein